MANPTLLDHLRAHLIDVGLVRDPDAGAGAAPPLWRHPDGGAVEPTADDPLTVSAFLTGGLTPATGAEDRQQPTVDLQFRSRAGVPRVIDLERAITLEIVGTNPGGRTDWVMGGLYVVQSRQWTSLAPIVSPDAPASTWRVGYVFEIRA